MEFAKLQERKTPHIKALGSFRGTLATTLGALKLLPTPPRLVLFFFPFRLLATSLRMRGEKESLLLLLNISTLQFDDSLGALVYKLKLLGHHEIRGSSEWILYVEFFLFLLSSHLFCLTNTSLVVQWLRL